MSHALLLRLFLSPYFSISVAMHYLKLYPESIGISHYLCWRMKSMPAEEVEFYWPQICHLLITYPTSSNALESFVLGRAEESTHSAMLTFWFLQSALKDLTPSRVTNPRPFLICQRVLHRCHEIIFGDPPEPSTSPYRSLPQSPALSKAPSTTKERSSKVVRVNPHASAALVGMGVVLAGPGMRGLGALAGEWAISQGRRPLDEDDGRTRVEVDKSAGADARFIANGRSVDSTASNQPNRKPSEESDASDDEKAISSTPARDRNARPPLSGSSNTTPNLHRPASTVPNLNTPPMVSTPNFAQTPSQYPSPVPSSKGVDPFSQIPPSSPVAPSRSTTPIRHQAFYSVPELSHTNSRSHHIDRPPSAEALIATYSVDAQRQLLRSHYCRSEIRFLLLLEDISNRLLVIPKPARVSALRAELTGLNHNLPAEVCMPLWCAADHCSEEGGETSVGTPLRSRLDHNRSSKRKGHSRVVRISPGDSVVLNSAERAPYLIHVELLEGDLDFDPSRRENRELLKKIVVQEEMKRRKGEGFETVPKAYEGFGSPMPDAVPKSDVAVPESRPRKVSTVSKTVDPEEVEEMDLVEQLYGARLSVKNLLPDLIETVPLPQGPKNKALDAAAWDRGGMSDGPSQRSSVFGTPHTPATDYIGDGSPRGHLSTPQQSAPPSPGIITPEPAAPSTSSTGKRVITLEDYSERMRTAAVMLAQLNASLVPAAPEPANGSSGGALSWIPGTGWRSGSNSNTALGSGNTRENSGQGEGSTHTPPPGAGTGGKLRLAAAQAAAIRDRIMEEMMALEEERVERMTDRPTGVSVEVGEGGESKTAEDEGIVRRELNKADPSAAVFKESWSAKKSRIRASSPWGHLANWDVISVIVKTGADLRQEQLATQLVERFSRIWKEEKCECWVRFFRILITGETSGLVETITDTMSIHSIKKGEYARRIAEGGPIGHVTLMDHFVSTYGKPETGRFARAQRNFIKSLAGYSIVTYLLQIKDRHNGNILVDRDGHLIHIDFGFMLSNSPGGNMGFEAAPFKLPLEYVEIMGGLDSPGWMYFKKLFKEGFEIARKHSDSLITIVELMQKNSKLDCFILFGEQTAYHFRERFALGLTTAAVDAYLERLILSSTGSNYTRLYDTFQYYSQGVL